MRRFIPLKNNRKKGERVSGEVEGKWVTFRKYKAIPKGCSVPRQICIVCREERIHKLSPNYSSKVCKDCALSASLRSDSTLKHLIASPEVSSNG